MTPASTHQISAENRLIITALVTATFVVILNETIMNVALPRLMAELHIDAPTVQWLATAFMLTMSVVIPTTGFLLQRLSRRTVFILAMSLFSAGTLLAALAPGFEVLLLARVVQACGTAIMLPLLMTSVLTLVPIARRGQVMGTVSIVISVAPAIGPTLSGLILQFLSWRFMFLTVLPIALASLFFGARKLVGAAEGEKPSLDLLSVVLTVPAFGGVVYGLSQLGGQGQGGLGPVLPLAVGIVCLGLFVARQLMLQRSGSPLLDLRAFTYPMYTIGTALLVVGMIALFGVIILLPIYLQQVRGLDTLSTGLLLLPGGLVMGLLAPTVGKWFDRVGPLPLTLTGTGFITAVLFVLAFLTADTPVWLVLALHIAMSLGLALLFTPAFTSGLNPLPPHLYSHGSAILSTLQQVAGAAGTALLVGVMAAQSHAVAASGATAVDAQMSGFRAAFLIAACVAIASVVLAAFLRNRPSVPAEEGAEPAAAMH
ncbi:DHA2 family efflux MFS transporter permease subunit [Sinomonas sp. ASV322]|uniref:DHA2 family efflux MFS transporter permease subunit n=1 Tax=Sinomonas sp. ASV322 TaxID=3041920 RepID=UPI0027DE4D22|nr:DHA2 family efflux MFS transporter permease subunit [Sinomonas sp. ASV322]MDQ4501590.1 DHA2 family efflux MFS transporter permease subunit [Sinomonas sp. ASV322]